MAKRSRRSVKTLILTGFGLNCEAETSAAFKYCGAAPEQIHLNDLLADGRRLSKFHVLVFIGGFSFGDHLGAGTVFANRIKSRVRKELEAFVADGKLVIGICNGFQTLTRLGLVPALGGKYFVQQAALAHNDSGVFHDGWVSLKAEKKCPCVFTKGLGVLRLPVRHGEGKFVADNRTLAEMERKHLVSLRYCDPKGRTGKGVPFNPNGSLNDIAGICDETGRIFGLMPHPEAFLSPFNAPDWTLKRLEGKLPKEGEGVAIFRNAVNFASQNLL